MECTPRNTASLRARAGHATAVTESRSSRRRRPLLAREVDGDAAHVAQRRGGVWMKDLGRVFDPRARTATVAAREADGDAARAESHYVQVVVGSPWRGAERTDWCSAPLRRVTARAAARRAQALAALARPAEARRR
jgi:hypothetical protein